jgi:hypothetical protein
LSRELPPDPRPVEVLRDITALTCGMARPCAVILVDAMARELPRRSIWN